VYMVSVYNSVVIFQLTAQSTLIKTIPFTELDILTVATNNLVIFIAHQHTEARY